MESSQFLQKITTWDANAARHILSRTLFGFTKSDVDFALSKSLDDLVDNYLLTNQPQPATPTTIDTNSEWVTLPYDPTDPNNNTNFARYFTSLIYWWLNLMMNQGYSIRERLVLFLHNHFVSEANTVRIPQFMYQQNKLFRDYSLGNFLDLTKKITIDPAMLLYLNGAQNTKNTPNENYARELMELFTLGIGNYTEDDIHNSAKALTGWRINNSTLTSYFDKNFFADVSKTFLGQTGNFGYEDIVNIIFSHVDTSSNPIAAQFVCRKLYKEFVYYQPDANGEVYISQLADVFKTNNYESKPVLSTLLKSQFFHSQDVRGAKIKSPLHFLLTALKQFQLNINNDIFGYVRSASALLSQDILNPPDVRGWQGQRNWISTTTYPQRNTITDSIINGRKIGTTTLKVDVVAYARTYSSSEKAVDFVNDVTAQLIQFPLSQTRKDELLQTMLDGAAVYDWSTYDPQAASRLSKFFKALMRLPEYQLS